MRIYPLLLLLALLLGCTSSYGQDNQTAGLDATKQDPPGNGTSIQEATTGGISSADLAQHNDASSCWILYNGEVYDVTNFLAMHPGGPGAIESYCGRDDDSFQAAFEGQHGTSKVQVLMQMGTNMGPHIGSMGMMGR